MLITATDTCIWKPLFSAVAGPGAPQSRCQVYVDWL